MKITFKLVLFALLILFGFYFVILASFGGFGKRRPALKALRQKDSVLLFAHRGLGNYFPENSIQAVEGSRSEGFNAVEVDITRSSDDELIVFHDDNCLRLLGLDQDISTLKTEEIKKHPIVFNNQKSGSYVATVSELLENKRPGMSYYFDMKLSSFSDADDMVNLIRAYHSTQSVILANWDILFILYVELRYPEIITALEGFDAGKEWTYYLMPEKLKPDFFSGYLSNLDQSHIDWLKTNNLMGSRIIYGVDSSNIDFALLTGFKNIIMNYDSVSTSKTLCKNYLNHSMPLGLSKGLTVSRSLDHPRALSISKSLAVSRSLSRPRSLNVPKDFDAKRFQPQWMDELFAHSVHFDDRLNLYLSN